MHYVHKKARCDFEIVTFRTKTIRFFQVLRLNWRAKIDLRGSLGHWSSILLFATGVSKKCWKETKTEETIGFFVTFLSLVKFQLGGRPAWLSQCSNCGKQKRYLQIFRAVSGVFQQNFNGSKISAVLEPRTRQFLRTWGFEAKAKDFKMCPRGRPRGQGRPRGLHLC